MSKDELAKRIESYLIEHGFIKRSDDFYKKPILNGYFTLYFGYGVAILTLYKEWEGFKEIFHNSISSIGDLKFLMENTLPIIPNAVNEVPANG